MGALVTLKTASAGLGSRERPDPADLSAAVSRAALCASAARDWLETQARVVEYWRDLLAESGAEDDLVEALDAHAAFLNGAAAGR